MPLRVMIADDHALVRAGLRALIERMSGVEIAGEAADGPEAVRIVDQAPPNVLLLDLSLPGLNGVDVLERLRRDHPGVRVLVVSMHTGADYVTRAMRAGARGYLVKDAGPDELEVALRAVARGDTYLSPRVAGGMVERFLLGGEPAAEDPLTPRQREVLQLVAEGVSTRAIARRLGLSVKTVEAHRAQIMQRLGVRDAAALVRYAVRVGLVDAES